MLDNVIFSANAVAPLIVLIFFGMFLKTRQKLFANPKDFFANLERFVFNIALPVFVFNEIAQAEVDRIFDVGLVLYCILAIIISCVLLMIIVPLFIKDKKMRGAFIHGVFRPNFALLGVPLVGILTDGSGSAAAALILSFVVPLLNILGVVILSVNSGDDSESSISADRVKKILKEIAKNPLIRAIIIGLPFMIFDIGLPEFVQRSINHIGNTSAPLALISLGAGVDLQILKTKIKLSLTAALMKTVVCPILFVVPAVLIGFRGDALAIIYVLFAAPSAVATYVMAKNMHSDAELAGQILALTTVICPATIFLGSLTLISIGVM